MISKKQYKKCIDKAMECPIDSVTWYDMGKLKNGKVLSIVFGWSDGYDTIEEYQVKKGKKFYTLCAKLAYNTDDLQCDYDWDWEMPWDEKTGIVWDTDMPVVGVEDAEFYNKEAKSIIDRYNGVEIEGVSI